jgi:hypothetical protein
VKVERRGDKMYVFVEPAVDKSDLAVEIELFSGGE